MSQASLQTSEGIDKASTRIGQDLLKALLKREMVQTYQRWGGHGGDEVGLSLAGLGWKLLQQCRMRLSWLRVNMACTWKRMFKVPHST